MKRTVRNYALIVLATTMLTGWLPAQQTSDPKKSDAAKKTSSTQKSKPANTKPSAGVPKKASDPDKVSDERMSTRGMHRPPKDASTDKDKQTDDKK
jgi:hypothetical protein